MRKHVENLKILRVVTSQIPKARFVEVSSHKQKSLGRAELSPVNITITASCFTRWSDKDDSLIRVIF